MLKLKYLLVGCFLYVVVAVSQNIEQKIFFNCREDALQIPERMAVRKRRDTIIIIIENN